MASNHYELASAVYKRFIEHVLIGGVFSDAEREIASGPMGETTLKGISAGTKQDIRPAFMSIVSGKGGWSADEQERAKYARFTNVSLVDHLTSVVRGATMFGAIDMVAAGVPETEIPRRLAVVAAVAFCHDLDKALFIPRSQDITPDDVAKFAERYAIPGFLSEYGLRFEPEQLLALVSEVERSRSGYIRKDFDMAGMRVPLKDCIYVNMADAMDSLFLNGDKGLDAALVAMAQISVNLSSDALKQGWRVVQLDDPNSPFLLDSLQYAVARECHIRHSFPPLMEVHHGGRLTCIIPSNGSDELLSSAFKSVASRVGGTIRVDVNKKGSISILDSRGDLNDLRAAVDLMANGDREKLLRVRVAFQRDHSADIDALLVSTGILPKWPDMSRFAGMLVPMWSGIKDEDELSAFHRLACLTVSLLACADAKPKTGIIQASQREAELLDALSEIAAMPALPEWLGTAKPSDRYPVLAALAAALAVNDGEFEDRLSGEGGILAGWLEGSNGRKGLVEMIDGSVGQMSHAMVNHFEALVSGRTVVAADESATGRCHFTNMPMHADGGITLKDGLYALKVSAFSGRSGRPEYFNKVAVQTLVSPVATAEHKLRQAIYGKDSDKRSVPMKISSPTTAGLFGGLVLQGAPEHFATYDFLRSDLSKQKQVYSDRDGVSKRVLVGRYAEFPTSLAGSSKEAGQIGFVRGVMEMALRLGRPVHVFQGMPRQVREFVYFDTLPAAIEMALGGCGLRLEQVKPAIRLLRGIEDIAQSPGFGLELAMAIADPDTRFSALCDTVSRAERREAVGIKLFAINILREGYTMKDADRSIVAFAEAMADYQRAPKRNDGINVTERGFRIALEQAELLHGQGLDGEEQLVAAIAGSIKADYDRGGLSFRKNGDEVLLNAAKVFVEKVWLGAFKATSPNAKLRRSAMAIYHWSFVSAVTARVSQFRTQAEA